MLGLEWSIIFQETDQLLENFSLYLGNQELTLKSAHSHFLQLNLIAKIYKASILVVSGK